ncbi:MAG: hypothetical protein ACE5KE_02435, partial [Methanosarcinales archaeon]
MSIAPIGLPTSLNFIEILKASLKSFLFGQRILHFSKAGGYSMILKIVVNPYFPSIRMLASKTLLSFVLSPSFFYKKFSIS